MSAVAPTEIHSPETWTRLEQSPQWAALTDSQRVWVTQFIATGSALLATQAGYKAKSEANARVLSYELAKNPSILAALDIAAGKVSPAKTARERLIATEQRQRKQLIATVRKQLKAAIADHSHIAAEKLTAQLERLQLGVKPEADEPSGVSQPKAEAFKVGQLVTQRDSEGILHTGKVLAIDAEGRATEIEEVL
jgi:hypothetical protein